MTKGSIHIPPKPRTYDISNGDYPKPLRIPLNGIISKGRTPFMSLDELNFLLSGKVLVEEKMDGKTVSLYSKCGRYLIFAEDVSIKHSIPYIIPAKFVVFDVLDLSDESFLKRDDKVEIVYNLRKGGLTIEGYSPIDFIPVPQVAYDKFNVNDLRSLIRPSYYASMGNMEGLVIKQNVNTYYLETLGTRGKIVTEEFTNDIDTHYLRKIIASNILNPSIPILLSYGNNLQDHEYMEY